jgi:membrane-bound metal-dependent hydrolase YbcI (DUF457 family)
MLMDDIVVSDILSHRLQTAQTRFMPTPVAHALAGTAVYLSVSSSRYTLRGRCGEDLWLFVTAVVAACFADLDFGLNFLTGKNYHHYFTHSLAFSTLFTVAAYFFAKLAKRESPARDAWILGAAYLTHILLDLFSKDTSPPHGMELFWPFSQMFVIAPVTLFDDIWRGTLAKLLGLHNWLAVTREALIVGPLVLIAWWRRAKRQSA